VRAEDVEQGLIGTAEEPGRYLGDAQVLEPVRWPELGFQRVLV